MFLDGVLRSVYDLTNSQSYRDLTRLRDDRKNALGKLSKTPTVAVEDEIQKDYLKAIAILREPVRNVDLPPGFTEEHLNCYAEVSHKPDFKVGEKVTTVFYGRRWKATVKEVSVCVGEVIFKFRDSKNLVVAVLFCS